MRVDIKTSGLELTDGLREHTERRLGFAFDRAHYDLSTITVRLSDINGPRGGADKRCQIQIPLRRHTSVVIEETDTDLYVAIDRAASRAGNTLARQLAKRHRQPGGRASVSLKHLLAADDSAQHH